jgi:hypothetical protein
MFELLCTAMRVERTELFDWRGLDTRFVCGQKMAERLHSVMIVLRWKSVGELKMRQFWNLMIASNRREIVVILARHSLSRARGRLVALCAGALRADGGGLRPVRLVAMGGDAEG